MSELTSKHLNFFFLILHVRATSINVTEIRGKQTQYQVVIKLLAITSPPQSVKVAGNGPIDEAMVNASHVSLIPFFMCDRSYNLTDHCSSSKLSMEISD